MTTRIIQKIKQHKIKTIILVVLLISYYFCLPKTLFKAPTSTVIESREGILLGAKIADDGQWRFPQLDSVPEKFNICIVQFEDEYFYNHPGFNPISIAKALWQNIESGEVKRGGSTLTQQVIRLSRKGQKRTYLEKLKELILATRLEFRHSKKDILNFYASHAPFGGNVVGLDAASWRYFGRRPQQLSWAENATLAVLPNAPSLIFPGKNQARLKAKRDRLLKKLYDQEIIDKLTYELAIEEPLPQKPYALPQTAKHLLNKISETQKGKRIQTSVKSHVQQETNAIVAKHYKELKQNQIYNASVLVLDVKTRKVVAYVGNTPTDNAHQKDVNIIHKPRSTGSIMKPFLYTAILDAGDLLPNTLVIDVPTKIGNYNPKNFNESYDGAVTAKRALARSLNVPAVRMLRQFGLERFHYYLKQLQLKDISYNADHYGLSLILGGAESNLWDLCKTYAAFSSTLNHFGDNSSQYYTNEFCEPSFLLDEEIDFGDLTTEKTIFDAGSIYLTYESLKEVNRPEGEENWEFFDSSKEIAWKTGTSFGFRDAWAIGSTKDYIVGVWVGNADGEGRPGLIGTTTAAPILFDVFDILPKSDWFPVPYDELEEVAICSKSGYRASELCEDAQQQFIPRSGLKTKPCPYHVWVHLDKDEHFQVNSSCQPLSEMTHKSWFVLPPLMEYYYQGKNPLYKTLPPYRNDCTSEGQKSMDFIYPAEAVKVFLPKDFDGEKNPLVLRLAHSIPETKVFWYVDEAFIGTTQTIHEMEILPKKGIHKITVVDEFGNEATRSVEIQE
ncbi:penicillin-binding protein 1C [uncultured Kordia sp.]|uniref:penicillin-binding protein 1C n=1 Tax=uncultured Kordia sp. TaxID=507699 RepID=UPI0026168BE7|nr:penicillin-binding protein 1C [uncultured Kordia sp.]